MSFSELDGAPGADIDPSSGDAAGDYLLAEADEIEAEVVGCDLVCVDRLAHLGRRPALEKHGATLERERREQPGTGCIHGGNIDR